MGAGLMSAAPGPRAAHDRWEGPSHPLPVDTALHPDRLRQLADLDGPERAFLTVYLDAHAERSKIDARLGEIRSLLADHEAETEHFEQNWETAQRLLDKHSPPDDGSLAVFVCWAIELAHVERVPVAVGTQIRVGDGPFVRPLYEALDEHETYGVAVVDNSAARLFLVEAGNAELERRVSGGVKNRVKVGGWSQKRYARRREKELAEYARSVADALQTLNDDQPYTRLVLLGSDETMQAVTQALPAQLVDLLADAQPVDVDAPQGELMETAEAVAQADERDNERALWEEIQSQGLGGDLGAFGPVAVLDAVRAARAEAVLVDREAELVGTRCRACEAVVYGTPDTCQTCGSADVFALDLVEHLVERAAQTGASVDFADPFPGLTDAGHVATLLRY